MNDLYGTWPLGYYSRVRSRKEPIPVRRQGALLLMPPWIFGFVFFPALIHFGIVPEGASLQSLKFYWVRSRTRYRAGYCLPDSWVMAFSVWPL